MIRRLRRNINLMVFLSLFVIIVCFVLGINWYNWHTLVNQADQTLDILVMNRGMRPVHEQNDSDGKPEMQNGVMETPPGPPPMDTDGTEERGEGAGNGSHQSGKTPGGPPSFSQESIAGLSNYYTIVFNENGEVQSWSSDRSDLYSEEQIEELSRQILASGTQKGRIGTQFFQLTQTEASSSMAVVLDARIEIMNAQNLLWSTVILGAAAYILLCTGAYFLNRRMFIPVEEANRKQRQFVWDASHELKTPIAVISANAEVLEREIGDNEWLGYIRSELERTSELVQSLLELARTDRETTKATMQPFDLSRAVLSVALPFESTVFENGKTMETEIPDGIEMVGNSHMIQQLVMILLSNALKYSEQGGKISLQLQSKGHTRMLRVHNTGSYISPEDRERIFDRFYRADSSHSRTVEGHGLGLAIAKNIVELHDGKISVESTPETGTAFTVTL